MRACMRIRTYIQVDLVATSERVLQKVCKHHAMAIMRLLEIVEELRRGSGLARGLRWGLGGCDGKFESRPPSRVCAHKKTPRRIMRRRRVGRAA